MTRIAISPRLATSTFSNMKGREVIATALGLAAAAVAPAPADAALRFEPCGPYGFGCARVSVPLDRTGVAPGRVSLFVKRIRARERPRRAPLVVLAGGPGQSATAAFDGDALSVLHPGFRNRDLIVFDQRGTGRSGVLRCRAIERANLLEAGGAAAACARRLGARRAFYASRDSVEDVEAIRSALGADKVTLFGTSYGTKVALGYALAHPGQVDRLVLDSVVEAAGPNALYLDTIEAVPRALRSLCRVGCKGFTADPVADVHELAGRLASRPLRGRLPDRRGRVRTRALDSGDLFAVLIGGDFDPALRASFPGAVRSALAGDPAPILRLRRRAYQLDGESPPPRLFSSMLYTATTCEETPFPWARSSPADPGARRAQAAAAAAALPDSAVFPFDRATILDNDLLELCGGWPAAPAAPDFAAGPLPDVPVLLIEGEDDLRTPVENAERVADLFPQASLVVAPETGHSALGSDRGACTERAFAAFFARRPVAVKCRVARRVFLPRPPASTTLRQVSPARGVGGARGRVLTALALTLRDVGEDALSELILDPNDPDLARGGGLRSGSYRIDGRVTLTLRGLAFVPGVRLSGRLERFGMRRQGGRIRVAAAAGVPGGLLRIRGRTVTGVLGGRRVEAALSTRAAMARVRAAAARLPGPHG